MVDTVTLPPEQNLTNIIKADSVLIYSSENGSPYQKRETKMSIESSKGELSEKFLE